MKKTKTKTKISKTIKTSKISRGLKPSKQMLLSKSQKNNMVANIQEHVDESVIAKSVVAELVVNDLKDEISTYQTSFSNNIEDTDSIDAIETTKTIDDFSELENITNADNVDNAYIVDAIDTTVNNQNITSKALIHTDPLAIYLSEIRKYPILTKSQEIEIAQNYQITKDPKLAEILVTSNLRFVVKVASEYAKFGAKMIDLVQEGNMGLMHAIKTFNPYKGVRLITYAVWWIRGHIQEYLMKQYSLVKIGTTQTQRRLFYQLQKEKQTLENLGSSGDYKQIAQILDVPEEEVKLMSQRLIGKDVSLHTEIDDDGHHLLDFQSDYAQETADVSLMRHEEIEILKKKLDEVRPQLNEKELFLLEHRILADEPMTLQEIGDRYSITREAIRQIEVRVLNRIKHAMLND